jgi:hypothetical protein
VARDVVPLPEAQHELAGETTFGRQLKMQVAVRVAAFPYPQEPFAMAVVEVPKAEAPRWRLLNHRQGKGMSARTRWS